MSRIQVWAWKCDREGCGHVWYTGKDGMPRACARCKARNWNVKVGVEDTPEQKAANVAVNAAVDAVTDEAFALRISHEDAARMAKLNADKYGNKRGRK